MQDRYTGDLGDFSKLGNSVAREKFLQKAAEDLIDEENEKLKKLLALQNHMS